MIWNFNTSNVIFYPKGDVQDTGKATEFQYIQCYFLSLSGATGLTGPAISIHPMLFFIFLCTTSLQGVFSNFNTSNVIFYPFLFQAHAPEQFISIHPMLFFIILRVRYAFGFLTISIHPMLFFIASTPVTPPQENANFNTSNVIFYRMGKALKDEIGNYFNTSNVIFYLLTIQTG